MIAKKTNELVSFIIAAYNEEKYINQCIDSCLAQTYQEIEICVTDDGSRDNTWNCLSLYNNDPRVKLARFSENRGKVAAFNNSFSMANGSYIAIMGADDLCDSDRIERSIKKIDKKGLVFGDMLVINEKGMVIDSGVMQARFGITEDSLVDFDRLLRAPCVFGGTILGRTEILKKIFPLNEDFGHEDWWIPLKASSISEVGYVNYPMICYRHHQGQTSGRQLLCHSTYKDWLRLKIRAKPYYLEIKREFDLTKKQVNFVDTQISQLCVYEGKIKDRVFSLTRILSYKLPTIGQVFASIHPRVQFFLLKVLIFLRVKCA